MKQVAGILIVGFGILFAACAHSTDSSFSSGGGGTGGSAATVTPGTGGRGGSSSTVSMTTSTTSSTVASSGSGSGGCVPGSASEQACTFQCMNTMQCGKCENNVCVCVAASECNGTQSGTTTTSMQQSVGSFISGIGSFISGIGSGLPSGSGGSTP